MRNGLRFKKLNARDATYGDGGNITRIKYFVNDDGTTSILRVWEAPVSASSFSKCSALPDGTVPGRETAAALMGVVRRIAVFCYDVSPPS